ncbi:AAA family ATPase [Oceanithermus sp.]
MRPLRLDLEGFGAFARHASVDFSDVELFAITGPTGSGKTTLLDAMTFALYGETPRMGRKGLKALLHPGVKKAWVQLVFRLGDEVWRVTRVIASKNEARLEKQLGAEWQLSSASEKIATLNQAIERLLGLDYDAFTRAILLPQGRFDAFLKGDSRERRELLFSLYGLGGLADLRERAVERLSELRERLVQAQTQAEQYAGVDEAAIASARDELQELAKERERLAGEIQRLEKELKQLAETAELWQERRSLENRRRAIEADAGRMAEVEQWIERARAAERALPEVRRLQQARENLARQTRELDKLKTAYEKAKKEWEKQNEAFHPDELEALRSRVAALPLLEARARTLAALGGAKGDDEATAYDETAYREIEVRLRELRDRQKAAAEAERLRKRRSELLKRREALLHEHEKKQQELDRLTAAGKQAAGELEELKERYAKEQKRASLAAYRHLLVPGEPCPLCLQPVAAPPPAEESALAQLEKGVRKKEAEVRRLREAWSEASGFIKGLQRQLGELEGQLATLEKDLQRLGDGAPVDAAQLTELEGRLAAMRRGLAAEIDAQTGGLEPAVYARRLRERLASLEERASRIAELQKRAEDAASAFRAAEERRKALAEALQPLAKSVDALLRQLGFSAVEEVERAQRRPEEVARLEKRLEEWRREKAYVAGRLQEMDRLLAGKSEVDSEELSAKKKRLLELQEKRARLEKEQGRLEERLTTLERGLEQKRRAEKEAAELVQKVGVWEQLAEDLKGHKFPDYLLERLQLDLLARASELLSTLSQHRYRFKLIGGGYHVEDLWTGAVRPAKTLSGGETFLASLSLALSLSEHLSRGRLGSLFLDEGFGTLDAEALELAAEVLEALPTQGRMVGVVTHVPELAQRMPARLVVEKSPQGSRVRWEE